MNWAKLAAFWAMGGYGLYVWGSFGMTLLCVVAEIGLLRRHRASTRWQRLRRMQTWESARNPSAARSGIA
jgi:heme exporter protein D